MNFISWRMLTIIETNLTCIKEMVTLLQRYYLNYRTLIITFFKLRLHVKILVFILYLPPCSSRGSAAVQEKGPTYTLLSVAQRPRMCGASHPRLHTLSTYKIILPGKRQTCRIFLYQLYATGEEISLFYETQSFVTADGPYRQLYNPFHILVSYLSNYKLRFNIIPVFIPITLLSSLGSVLHRLPPIRHKNEPGTNRRLHPSGISSVQSH
jgi:hypothetical protein